MHTNVLGDRDLECSDCVVLMQDYKTAFACQNTVSIISDIECLAFIYLSMYT